MTNIASIDIGSHTARLLVSQKIGPPGLFQPIIRKRVYIRLAEGFDHEKEATISPEAIDRTLNALEDFAAVTNRYNVDATHAVATGVVRNAVNRDHFLELISVKTGIRAKIISGEKEAQLTCKGVLHSLDLKRQSFIIFDLGGGSTEFILGEKHNTSVESILIGAMILTQKFFRSDPPEDNKIEALKGYVDKALEEAFPEAFPGNAYAENNSLMIGTGGTVTTLAAMINSIGVKEIGPDMLNGLIIERAQIEDLFSRIRPLTIAERLRLPGLDQGRADVILAGALVVIRILYFFRSTQMTVSLSDLLEGILIVYLQGEEDE